MLGILASRREEYYIGYWISTENKKENGYFRFGIIKDDNLQKIDFNKLSTYQGNMNIKTKSLLNFMPEDVVMFRNVRYNIVNVDSNRKESGEAAQTMFNNNGNVDVYLTLRRAGV